MGIPHRPNHVWGREGEGNLVKSFIIFSAQRGDH